MNDTSSHNPTSCWSTPSPSLLPSFYRAKDVRQVAVPFIQRTIPTLPSRHFFFSFDVALVACSLLTWLGVVDFVGMEVDHGNQLIIDHCIR